MVQSGPGGLLYPYVVRGYRKSTDMPWKNSLALQLPLRQLAEGVGNGAAGAEGY